MPSTACPTCSTWTATSSAARTAPWCWACASSTRAGGAEGDQNWSNLHNIGGIGWKRPDRRRRPAPRGRLVESGIAVPRARRAAKDVLTCTGGLDGYEDEALTSARTRRSTADRTLMAERWSSTCPRATAARRTSRRRTIRDGAGVPIGGLANQLLYAVKFSEPNLLLSSRVHDNSKILYDRDPRQMVEKVAPGGNRGGLASPTPAAIPTARSSGSSTATPSPTSSRSRSGSRSRR